MLNEIRRVFSKSTPAAVAEAICGLGCLFGLLALFLIVTP
jgi:hypothetical protein